MTFDHAYDAWLRRLLALGYDAPAFLNAPADASALDAAEASIGFALPSDFRALYGRADGQVPPFNAPDPASGTITLPFFGSYDFISLAQALVEYELWNAVYVDAGESFHTDFDQCTARSGDPVYPHYWRPGWLPFSKDGGGNAYAVDLSPAERGSYGQVIVIGPDEDERRVLAPGIGALLAHMTTLDIAFQEEHGLWRCFDIESLGQM